MRAILAAAVAAAVLCMACQAAPTVRADNKVQVFILMGQSNMLGEGKIEPPTQNGTLE